MIRAALAALLFALADGGAATSTLRVHVHGVRSTNGKLGCTLFDSAADFPKNADKAVARMWMPITGAEVTCEFASLAPGVYAVSVLHDENGNGKMDTGIFNIPKEGYGASKNKLPAMSAPGFDENKLTLPAGVTEIDVTLRYP